MSWLVSGLPMRSTSSDVSSMRRTSASFVTMSSCRAKMFSMSPSIFSALMISPVSVSLKCGVSRMRGPAFWNPPNTTQRAPMERPSSRAVSASSLPPRRSAPTRWRVAWSLPTTLIPEIFFRSTLTVSEIPLESQSISVDPLMLLKSSTNTALRFSRSCSSARSVSSLFVGLRI